MRPLFQYLAACVHLTHVYPRKQKLRSSCLSILHQTINIKPKKCSNFASNNAQKQVQALWLMKKRKRRMAQWQNERWRKKGIQLGMRHGSEWGAMWVGASVMAGHIWTPFPALQRRKSGWKTAQSSSESPVPATAQPATSHKLEFQHTHTHTHSLSLTVYSETVFTQAH